MLFVKVPLTSYRSALGLDQGRSMKPESDIIWMWQLKEPLNNRHESSPPPWPSCPIEVGSLAPSKAGIVEAHLLFYCFYKKWILLMSVIYKQGSRQNPRFSWAAVLCFVRAREEVMGRYRLLCLACKVTCSDRASFHIYPRKQIPFQALS